MVRRRLLSFLAILWLAAANPAGADDHRPPPALFGEVERLVAREFYDPDAITDFRATLAAEAAALPADAGPDRVAGALDRALASLDASHTVRLTPDRIDYYELGEILRGGIRRDLRRLFPPDGEITYPGIGLITREIAGRLYAAEIYDGSAADRAGVQLGDEIVAIDGAPYREIESFRGKEGRPVAVTVRRSEGGPPIRLTATVQRMRPTDALVAATRASAEVVERDGLRIGVIRLWSYHDDDFARVLAEELATGRLAGIDGLVLDLRGRWGGAPGDAAEIFVGGTPAMTFAGRDGRERFASFRWRGPLIAIIDGGTRSGMEVMAYGLKRNGIALVGERTAGDLLAGRAFALSDGSLLELAVLDVRLDGERLEGVGVAPDIPVNLDVPYAAGADPQRDAAIAAMARRLADG